MSRENFYNIGQLDSGITRALAEGMTATIFPGEQMMLSVVKAEANVEGSLHSHLEEQWGMLLEGSGTRIQGGEHVEVAKGDFWHTPGNVEHAFIAGPEGATVLDMFAPPRAEYRKSGAGYGG